MLGQKHNRSPTPSQFRRAQAATAERKYAEKGGLVSTEKKGVGGSGLEKSTQEDVGSALDSIPAGLHCHESFVDLAPNHLIECLQGRSIQ